MRKSQSKGIKTNSVLDFLILATHGYSNEYVQVESKYI